MAVVGIDLGTTYSVIATPKEFPESRYLERLHGVTIIKDRAGRKLLPSVVAVNARGDIKVGHMVKASLADYPGAVLFAKRTLGQEKEYELGSTTMRPEHVSAEILRRLKEIAEAHMEEPIDEAVITVPAWFSERQKQLTKEAGEMAGLHVSEILQEPVAAALMYCYDDQRDRLTIMTFDLGGGTFDVAILRKEAGVFNILAHEGDRFLGGYDFDSRLAEWIIKKLREQHCELAIEPESPDWYRLLLIVEQAKEQLTDLDLYSINNQHTGLRDVDDEPVVFEDLVIDRETFEDLIADYAEDAIRCCRDAIAIAQIEPGEIDEIVMVGGSSRIPLFQRRLEAEFGIKPRLTEPDLCVAIGAAIAAQRLGKHVGPLYVGYIPESTSLPAIQVTGTVTTTEDTPEPARCHVALRQDGGPFSQQQPVTEHGAFVFPAVPLAAEQENTFTLYLQDDTARDIATHHFSIRHTASSTTLRSLAGLEVGVLAQAISIDTVSGLHVVAGAGTPLDSKYSVNARTMDRSGKVRVPVYEGNVEIGSILVKDIPPDLPVGTRVVVTLELKRDFFIDGEAEIPAIGARASAHLRIPPVVVQSLEELREAYEELDLRAQEVRAQADPGEVYAIWPRVSAALKSCRKILYEEQFGDRAKAQDLLAQVETLLGNVDTWQPNPPFDEFDEMHQEIKDYLLPALYNIKPDAAKMDWDVQLKAIVSAAEKALRAKSDEEWITANRELDRLRNRVSEALERAEKAERRKRQAVTPPREPDPATVKLQLLMELSALRDKARVRGRLRECEPEFQACQETLDKIDPEEPGAMGRLSQYYQGQHMPLASKIHQSRFAPREESDDGENGKLKAEDTQKVEGRR